MIPEIESNLNILNTQSSGGEENVGKQRKATEAMDKSIFNKSIRPRIINEQAGNRKKVAAELCKLAKQKNAELVEESIEFDESGGVKYEFEQELNDSAGMIIQHYYQNPEGQVNLLKKIIIEYANETGTVNHYCCAPDGFITHTKISPDGKKEVDYMISDEKKQKLENERDELQGTLNILTAVMENSDNSMKKLFEEKQKKMELNLNNFNNIFNKLNNPGNFKYADFATNV